MDKGQKDRRRRFTFSLRTLFVVITACCIYAGWQVSFVSQRRAMRSWVEAGGGNMEPFYLYKPVTVPTKGGLTLVFGHGPSRTDFELPLIRQWLGDVPIWSVSMRHDASEAQIAKCKRLFPEVEDFDVVAPPWE
jgi:hypothetical protein